MKRNLNQIGSKLKTIVPKKMAIEKTSLESWMNQFDAGFKHDNPDVIRTHGTLGTKSMYSIPSDKEEEFLRMYIKHVCKEKETAHLDQKPSTPYTNFFMDYDFKFKEELKDMKYILDVVSEVCRIVSEFFPELRSVHPKNHLRKDNLFDSKTCQWSGAGGGFNRLRSMVCDSPMTKSTTKDENGNEIDVYCLGIHQYWIGKIPVTLEQCSIMSAYIQDRLEKNFELRNPNRNPWCKVIDSGIYGEHGGMRMIGSMKPTNCECKDDEKMKKNCKICKGKGKLSVLKTYSPLLIFNGNGQIDEECDWIIENPEHYILASNLRINVKKQDVKWTVPENAKQFEERFKEINKDKNNDKRNNQLYPESVNHYMTNEIDDSSMPSVGQYLNIESNKSLKLENTIQSFDEHWNDIKIATVVKKKSNVYEIRLKDRGIGAKYCMKKSDYHSNQNIFFTVTKLGIYQNCRNPICNDKKMKILIETDNLLLSFLFGTRNVKNPIKENMISPRERKRNNNMNNNNDNNNNNNDNMDEEEERDIQDDYSTRDQLLIQSLSFINNHIVENLSEKYKSWKQKITRDNSNILCENFLKDRSFATLEQLEQESKKSKDKEEEKKKEEGETKTIKRNFKNNKKVKKPNVSVHNGIKWGTFVS